MKTSTIAAIFMATATVGTVQANDLVYDVDLVAGADTITGTITTDGTSGTIYFNNVLSFDLSIFDGTNTLEATTANGGYLAEYDVGNFFQATSSELTYGGDGTAGLSYFGLMVILAFFASSRMRATTFPETDMERTTA